MCCKVDCSVPHSRAWVATRPRRHHSRTRTLLDGACRRMAPVASLIARNLRRARCQARAMDTPLLYFWVACLLVPAPVPASWPMPAFIYGSASACVCVPCAYVPLSATFPKLLHCRNLSHTTHSWVAVCAPQSPPPTCMPRQNAGRGLPTPIQLVPPSRTLSLWHTVKPLFVLRVKYLMSTISFFFPNSTCVQRHPTPLGHAANRTFPPRSWIQ